ncbi:MAG TPA: hypothetical protein EYP41_17300 [Anaerolineae bacterium]|nr:hypothetical protein [Anaerolineae bacterium]HIP69879.1 hypothetical protein [Anaerolineae bacterium]
MFYMSRARKVVLVAVVNILIIVGLFLLMEGFFSVLFVGRRIQANKPIAERLHTEYDLDLGWVNKPGVVIENMYGSGIDIRINSQSLRADYDYSATVLPGRVRVICSGDSFTFGYGVANNQTWCALLGEEDKRLEMVNMGQGGYGLDQSYLWYKQGAANLAHDIHLFAPVVFDYERLRLDSFFGYGKPYLMAQDGVLHTENVPVPRQSYLLPWLTRNGRTLQQLRTVQFLQSQRPLPEAEEDYRLDSAQAQEVVALILADLQKISRENGVILVIVYLPTREDYYGEVTDSWRELAQEETARQGILFIDLMPDFQALPPDEVEKLFISEGALVEFYGATGHYTEAGNALVAQLLYEKMRDIPELADKLAQP